MDPQKFKNHCLKYLCPPNSILLSFLFSLCSMILFSCMISSTPMVSWNISRSQIHIFKALRLYTRLPSGCLYFEVLETAQRFKHQNETIFFPPNHYSFCIPCLNERPYYQPTWDRNPKAISDSFLFLIALPPRCLGSLFPLSSLIWKLKLSLLLKLNFHFFVCFEAFQALLRNFLEGVCVYVCVCVKKIFLVCLSVDLVLHLPCWPDFFGSKFFEIKLGFT